MLLLNTKYTKKLTLSELLIVNKSDLLTECDPRLKSFLKSATEKKKYRSKNDKESRLSNIFENILKSRNSNFFCIQIKSTPHCLCPGKNHDVSDFMS